MMRTTERGEGRAPTKREQQAIERREQILKAALRLFGRQGFAATTTKQIAQEAGIAEGLVFHYFPSKMHLFSAIATQRQPVDQLLTLLPQLADRPLDQLRTLMPQATDGPIELLLALLPNMADRPIEDLLQLVARGFLQRVRQDSDFVSMIVGEAQTNAEMGRMLQQLLQGNAEQLAVVLQARVDRGELRADLPVLTSAVTFFSSLIVFFLTHRHATDAEWQAQAETHVAEALDVWFNGARASA